MEKKQKWALWALSSVPLVMTLGNSMLIPILPVIERQLNISHFQVSLIITVYSISAILLIPIAGYLSDRWGRKKVIIPSLIITAIGGIITGWASWKLANPYMWILIGRVIQGIGAAGAMPVVIPCVGDMFKDDDEVSKGLGLIETSNTLGKVLSPILGSALAMIIWFMPFLFIPVLCAAAIILILMLVKPPTSKQEKVPVKEFISVIKEILHENGRWLYTIFLIGAIIMFILFGMLFYLSNVLEDRYHINGITKGFVLAIPLLALSITSYITGKKIGDNQKAMKWCICIGLVMLGGSLLIPLFSKSLYILIATFVIGGIGIGAALPSLDAFVTEGIDKKHRGTVTSLYSSMRFIGVAAGPPIFSLLIKGTDNIIFYVSIALSFIGAFLTLRFIKPTNEEKVSKHE
ncbi:MFS transporter [Priestia taiwanensis]|uniref:Multidrug resistance protein n=1 Tax=Priestia taiwanensis TaxID=1347902 RepID=A0A917ALT6_9BACI|nr:MFS transporter [Priestia taiwanensis]MBM7362309.1 ACDE family multidrug resistance protein [Priestia taiwanensis]GGE61138.1 multidrug resistance protein [Priestia taiwanensis]